MMLWSVVAWAGCDAEALDGAVDRAEAAFAAMDADGFDAAQREVGEALGCQQRVLEPARAARVHEIAALAAFLAGDDSLVVSHLRAAVASDPGFRLSESLAPPGHPLEGAMRAATAAPPGATATLAPPRHGFVAVDGLRSDLAPTGRPFLFQHVLSDGSAVITAPVRSLGEVPAYAEARPKRARRRALLGSGITVGLASVVLYGAAFSVRGTYDDAVAAGDESRIVSTHGTTRRLAVAGALGVLGGAGLVVASRF